MGQCCQGTLESSLASASSARWRRSEFECSPPLMVTSANWQERASCLQSLFTRARQESAARSSVQQGARCRPESRLCSCKRRLLDPIGRLFHDLWETESPFPVLEADRGRDHREWKGSWAAVIGDVDRRPQCEGFRWSADGIGEGVEKSREKAGKRREKYERQRKGREKRSAERHKRREKAAEPSPRKNRHDAGLGKQALQ